MRNQRSRGRKRTLLARVLDILFEVERVNTSFGVPPRHMHVYHGAHVTWRDPCVWCDQPAASNQVQP